MMLLVFVHGWSVTHTDTYGALPEALHALAPAALNLHLHHLFLGRYISFEDEVRMDDLARAFDQALRDQLPDNADGKRRFSCITHSTGGPLVRSWIERFYGKDKLDQLPLEHLIMLAPANFGSALAQLGKSRLGRIKSWASGVEPGQRILHWLELGSHEAWELARRWLAYDLDGTGFFPFVLTGQYIDSKLYDFLNSYTGEKGSDGVVRVAAANMNFTHLHLRQTFDVIRQRPLTTRLEVVAESIMRPAPSGMEVIEQAAHSGKKHGIMRSVENGGAAAQKPIVGRVLQCLQVVDRGQYGRLIDEMEQRTAAVQAREGIIRGTQFIFSLRDDEDHPIVDFDLLLLAGGRYDPNRLPKGFFLDRQRNSQKGNKITYFLNHDKIAEVESGKLGFRIIARPSEGFCHYISGEFRSEDIPLENILRPNQTVLVDIELIRKIDKVSARLDPATSPRISFKKQPKSGEYVDS